MATIVEWTPNEGILRKFERLAFALVRTGPSSRLGREQYRQGIRNPWTEKCRGLGGPFALGILIAIPCLTEVTTGSALIAALLLAAIDAAFAVWLYTDLESQHGHCSGDIYACTFSSVGEFPAFLIGWWRIQGFSAGFAACCRSLSEIVDSVTGRHAEAFVEDHFGNFLPLGAKMDVLAFFVATVPTLMCSLGMEESGFLRTCLFLLTSGTTLAFFGSSLLVLPANKSSSLTFESSASAPLSISSDTLQCLPDDGPIGTQYAKILTAAALASVGFFGIYKIACPDGASVQYNHRGHGGQRHYTLTKRFSLIGCLITTVAFLFYFLEATVLSKAPHTSRICRDPPLLWPLEGGWRIGIASLGISALSLATFEFLIPLCSCVTKLANDGLLYRLLRKDRHDFEESKWTMITPLVFGTLSGFQALLVETKILIGFVSSSLMGIHLVTGGAMLASRYQVRISPSPHTKVNQSRHRMRLAATAGTERSNQGQTRRLLTVSFLKSGLSKIPHEIKKLELDGGRNNGGGGASGGCNDPNSDRSYLMDDVAIASLEPRDSVEFSIDSAVSGYESDSDAEGSTTSDLENCNGQVPTGEMNIDAAVAEYHQRMRLAALNGGAPLNPTPASARRVSFATVFLIISCLTLAAALNRVPKMDFIGLMLAGSSGLLLFLLLVVISRQPQRKVTGSSTLPPLTVTVPSDTLAGTVPNTQGTPTMSTSSTFQNFFQYSLVPCAPAMGILLHSCLLVEALDFCGFLFAIWFATGLIIYFSYGVSKSVAAPNLISLISPTSVGSERVRLASAAAPCHENRGGISGSTAHGSDNVNQEISSSVLNQSESVLISRA